MNYWQGVRKSHCINGHPFSEENTKWVPRKRGNNVYQVRICKACKTEFIRRWYERYKAKRQSA